MEFKNALGVLSIAAIFGITALYFSSSSSREKEIKIAKELELNKNLFRKAEEANQALIEQKDKEIREVEQQRNLTKQNLQLTTAAKIKFEEEYNNLKLILEKQKTTLLQTKSKLVSDFSRQKEQISETYKAKLNAMVERANNALKLKEEAEKKVSEFLKKGKAKICFAYNEKKECLKEKEYQMPQDAQKIAKDFENQKRTKEQALQEAEKKYKKLREELRKNPEKEKELRPQIEEARQQVQDKKQDLENFLGLAAVIGVALGFPPAALLGIVSMLGSLFGSGPNPPMGEGRHYAGQSTAENEIQKNNPNKASRRKRGRRNTTRYQQPFATGTKTISLSKQNDILSVVGQSLFLGNRRLGKASSSLAEQLKQVKVLKKDGANYVIRLHHHSKYCHEIFKSENEWKLKMDKRTCM